MQYVRPILGVLRWEGVVLVGALGLAEISNLATQWFLGFIVLAAVLLVLAWARAAVENERARRFRGRAERVGVWIWGFLLVFTGTAIFWRFSTPWVSVVFAITYALVGAFHLRALYRGTSPMIAQFRLVIALSVAPILTAWILNSVLYAGWIRVVVAGPSSQQAQAHTERLATRALVADSWERGGGVRVAVTLSGGGYRASVVHAGLLSALDRAGLPVHYLSTVSGGSITGATYALGWPPGEFRDHLKRTRPGLPNDLANFVPLFKQLLIPSYGTGDTYAEHFDRVYFRGAGMEDTGPPVLILNATRYREGTREAFWPGRSNTGLIAREVAASGAFPVAFEPVRIGELAYMDGGVVENLGLAGLEQYFGDAVGDPEISRLVPGVLIISDVGVIPELPRSRQKPSVLEMAMHTQQVSYFAMHQWIYGHYTGGRYDWTGDSELDQPYEVEAGLLWPDLPPSERERTVQVFVLSATSPAERAHFEGQAALIEAVSSFQTLKELSPEEVDAAFWVGARLAEVYMPLICEAARAPECEEVDLAPTPPEGWD